MSRSHPAKKAGSPGSRQLTSNASGINLLAATVLVTVGILAIVEVVGPIVQAVAVGLIFVLLFIRYRAGVGKAKPNVDDHDDS
jgi:O-antigen ligase